MKMEIYFIPLKKEKGLIMSQYMKIGKIMELIIKHKFNNVEINYQWKKN